jgi:type IV pilus assembly protein PilN
MANINLLPWREELRQEKQRQFLSVLGLVAIFGVVVMFATYTLFEEKLKNQKDRNQYLTGKIKELDFKIKEIETLEKEREELVARMKLIQDLQKSRPQVVHLFDEIVRAVPEGVSLLSIKRSKDSLVFEGIAESGPRVSDFLRKIESSGWIHKGDLKEINDDKDSGANRKTFILESKVSSPNKEEVEVKS